MSSLTRGFSYSRTDMASYTLACMALPTTNTTAFAATPNPPKTRTKVVVRRGPRPKPVVPTLEEDSLLPGGWFKIRLHSSDPKVGAYPTKDVSWTPAAKGAIQNANTITWTASESTTFTGFFLGDGTYIPLSQPVSVQTGDQLDVKSGGITISMDGPLGGLVLPKASPVPIGARSVPSPAVPPLMAPTGTPSGSGPTGPTKEMWPTQVAAAYLGISVTSWLSYMSRDKKQPWCPKPIKRGRGRSRQNIYSAEDVRNYKIALKNRALGERRRVDAAVSSDSGIGFWRAQRK